MRTTSENLSKFKKNPFKCKSCDNTFTNNDDLHKHTSLCNKKNLKCRVCGKEFSVTKELKLHLRSHIKPKQEEKVPTKEIPKIATNIKTEIPNQEYKCKVCNEDFNDIEKLMQTIDGTPFS